MSTIPGYSTRRGWQAIATGPGYSRCVARGARWWCTLAAAWHRLHHPTHRITVRPVP